MARQRRVTLANHVYHVMNRAAKRSVLFGNASDYLQFERTLESALARLPMRILAYCMMPTHFHLLLWPRHDALNADLVVRTEDWRWRSLWRRMRGPYPHPLCRGPATLPPDWVDLLNAHLIGADNTRNRKMWSDPCNSTGVRPQHYGLGAYRPRTPIPWKGLRHACWHFFPHARHEAQRMETPLRCPARSGHRSRQHKSRIPRPC
jgi:REP element-mobilizing transposase RayT